jgi:hypothetical protein
MDKWTIVAVVGAFALGCIVTFVAIRPPGSYERCMLDEMRGRPTNQDSLADAYCQKRFPQTGASAPSASASSAPRPSLNEAMEKAVGIPKANAPRPSTNEFMEEIMRK